MSFALLLVLSHLLTLAVGMIAGYVGNRIHQNVKYIRKMVEEDHQ